MATVLELRRDGWLPALHQLLVQGVDQGVFPGAAACVFHEGERLHLSATGERSRLPSSQPATTDTLWDLASLTKVIATTSVAAVLVGQQRLALDELVMRRIRSFARGGKQAVTVRDLLAHRSGLPAWLPLFKAAMDDVGAAPHFHGRHPPPLVERSRRLVLDALWATPPLQAPRLSATYSDLGFMALGELLATAGEAPLDALADALVFRPLGLRALHFRPLGRRKRLRPGPLAATGLSRPREPAAGQEGLFEPAWSSSPPGEVDDDNAFALGGVAGHAGLFGTAEEVARFGAFILEELSGAARLAPASLWETFASRDTETPGSTRALGWDTRSPENSCLGSRLGTGPLGGFGHTGFTGTSLWVDRDRKLSVALLTNRTHPARGNDAIRAFRRAFHDAVADALG